MVLLPACDGEPVAMPAVTLELDVDPDVTTLIHASWGEGAGSIRYQGAGGWMETPTAEGEAVLLGLAADTEVHAELVMDGVPVATAITTTGSLPIDLPGRTVDVWDPTRTQGGDWLLTTVDAGYQTWRGPYYLVILHRGGDVVWYHEVRDGLATFFSGVSLDGTHVWVDANPWFDFGGEKVGGVTRTTLDGAWVEQVELPDYLLGIDETPAGWIYADEAQAMRTVEDEVWSCPARFPDLGEGCLTNAVVWDEERGTAFWSSFVSSTVVEVDVATGEVVREFGQAVDTPIDPPEAVPAYQHYPGWTAAGTVLVSSHVKESDGVQTAYEYAATEAGMELVWEYRSPDHYAEHAGEAWRHPDGNTFLGYGTGGAVRELAGDEVVWELRWEPNEDGQRMIGHTEPLADLYAVNRGPG